MVLDLQVEVIAEDPLVPAGHVAGDIGAIPQDRLGDFTTETGGGNDQPLAVALEGGLIDASPGKDAPTTHAPQVADARQLHQIAIADSVLGENNQVVAALFLRGIGVINGAIDDIHLVADDRLHRAAAAELQELNGAVHDAVVGEGDRRHAQLLRPLHHGRQLTRPIQKAVVAVVVEGDEGQARRERWSQDWRQAKPATPDSGLRSPVRQADTPPLVIRAPGKPGDASPSPERPARSGTRPGADAPLAARP